MTGTLISQLIPFLIAPILTRLFSPEEFGMFGLYFSITMIISVFITGRYEMAIMLPREEKDAVNLMGLSMIITTVICLILFFIVLIFKGYIAIWLQSPAIENWLFLLPITMFAIGTYQTFNYWNNRKEKYNRLSLSRVARSVNTSGWSIGLAFTVLKKGGMILGDCIGQLFSTGFLFLRTWKEDKHLYKEISKEKMKEQAARYSQFPKFNVVSGLFEKMSGQMPVLFFSSFFGEAITGFFSFSQRIVGAPGAIIAKAFGDVFRQKATVEFQKSGNCKELFIKTFIRLIAIATIPFILFYFFAPELFAFIFGEKWRIAGEYSVLLTPMFFLQFVVSPLSNMFLVAEKQKLDLILQLFLVIAVLTSFLCGFHIFREPEMCLILFTIAYSIKYLIELYLSFHFSKGKNP